MVLNDNIKRILSIFGAFFIIFLSFFMFSFGDKNKVFADTSSPNYSFRSSDVVIPFTPLSYAAQPGTLMPLFNGVYYYYYFNFNFSLYRDSSNNLVYGFDASEARPLSPDMLPLILPLFLQVPILHRHVLVILLDFFPYIQIYPCYFSFIFISFW